MRYFVLLTLLMSLSAVAATNIKRKVSVDFVGDRMGNRIYYRCDSAIALLEEKLEALGAHSIESNCIGGLERYGHFPYWQPLNVSATFEVEKSAERKTVILNAERNVHEDCFLNVAIVESVLPLIPDAKIVKKKNSCLNNETPWSFTVLL